MKIHTWGQRVAVAAMLVLALGGTASAYRVLGDTERFSSIVSDWPVWTIVEMEEGDPSVERLCRRWLRETEYLEHGITLQKCKDAATDQSRITDHTELPVGFRLLVPSHSSAAIEAFQAQRAGGTNPSEFALVRDLEAFREGVERRLTAAEGAAAAAQSGVTELLTRADRLEASDRSLGRRITAVDGRVTSVRDALNDLVTEVDGLPTAEEVAAIVRRVLDDDLDGDVSSQGLEVVIEDIVRRVVQDENPGSYTTAADVEVKIREMIQEEMAQRGPPWLLNPSEWPEWVWLIIALIIFFLIIFLFRRRSNRRTAALTATPAVSPRAGPLTDEQKGEVEGIVTRKLGAEMQGVKDEADRLRNDIAEAFDTLKDGVRTDVDEAKANAAEAKETAAKALSVAIEGKKFGDYLYVSGPLTQEDLEAVLQRHDDVAVYTLAKEDNPDNLIEVHVIRDEHAFGANNPGLRLEGVRMGRDNQRIAFNISRLFRQFRKAAKDGHLVGVTAPPAAAA